MSVLPHSEAPTDDPQASAATLPSPPPIAREPLSIGGVPIPSRFFLAPLAGYTGLAFRLSVRAAGGLGMATTDLVNARALLENKSRSLELAETCPEDRPMAIQIYGALIEEMTEAARRVVDLGATIVDINMGCPVRKVVRCGGGSALMCEADAASALVGAVVEAAKVPVTVKMRLGWDEENLTAPALARAFEQVGAAAVIIHGRTRAQGFRGSVDREGIRAVVEAVDRIPIVGNGDVKSIADAERMLRETGCAAISIGRGALADPFLFRKLQSWAETGDPGPEPPFAERMAQMRAHFRGLLDRRGERFACLQFRKHVKWYSYVLRPPKPLYLDLIRVGSAADFGRLADAIEAAGPRPTSPHEAPPSLAVPSGPIDKW